MKKLLCMLLCLCAILTAPLTLASCQGTPKEKDPADCKHTVTFMVDGKVYTVLGYDELPGKLDMPTYPAKENAAFAGWYEDEAGTEKPFSDVQWLRDGGGHITVYATFERAYLVPMRIEAETFREKIVKPLEANAPSKAHRDVLVLLAHFSLKAYATEANPAKKEVVAQVYPITMEKNIDIYAMNVPPTDELLAELESYIKKYCPDYTFEDLAEDHSYVEYLAQPIAD